MRAQGPSLRVHSIAAYINSNSILQDKRIHNYLFQFVNKLAQAALQAAEIYNESGEAVLQAVQDSWEEKYKQNVLWQNNWFQNCGSNNKTYHF